MKRGTAAKVILGKDALMDVPAGIVHGTDVILGGKAGLLNDFGGLVLSNNLMIGKKVSRGTITTITVRGQSPLVLPDAISGSLQAVKAFGGTEQRNLPDGYTQVEYLEGDGTQYIDLGYKGNGNTKVEVKFKYHTATSAPGSGRVFGSRIAAQNDAFAIGTSADTVSTTRNILFWCYDNQPYLQSDENFGLNVWKTVVFSATEHSIDGVSVGDDYEIVEFETPQNLKLFGFDNNGSMGVGYVDVAYCKLWDNGVLVRDLVPTRRNSDNALGMYDRVSGTFLTNDGTGTFAAGGEAVPTPDAPMDIVSNNGVLKARHQSGLPFGYTLLEYVSNSRASVSLQIAGFNDATSEIHMGWKTDSASVSSNYQAVFTVWTDNQHNSWRMLTYLTDVDKYYVYGNSKGPATASNVALDTWHDIVCKSGQFIIDSTTYNTTVSSDLTVSTRTMTVGGSQLENYYKYIKIKRQGEWIANFIPAKRESDGMAGLYDLINNRFIGSSTFTAGPEVSDPVEIYTDGTVETIEDTIGNTATAEMLLKVGDYQDEQEIISGAVTRNVGIKVLDGTEEWRVSGNLFYAGIATDALEDTHSCYCTHFKGVATNTSANFDNEIKVGTNATQTVNWTRVQIYPIVGTYSDVTTFKQYLAAQYNAGTPVIVIYPLATPTTESVTGQALQVTGGDNVLEITQASLNNLELEATYNSLVQLTIQEVEDANLNNNVEVTIS